MKKKDIIAAILSRPGIESLNPMQERMAGITDSGLYILLAPTGSGKTLAFAIPMLTSLKPPCGRVQAVVMAPSRELVMQIHDVVRPLATGYKTVAFYGGHPMQEEKNSLAVTPDIVIATPGRLLDHINRGHLDLEPVSTLVLDEYDKSLELGFSDEMSRICRRLKRVSLTILTSATPLGALPDYIPSGRKEEIIDFTQATTSPRGRMQIVQVPSPTPDKLQTLTDLLHTLPNGKVIVFVNHRESAERVYDALMRAGLPAGLYHGGLEQADRENAIALLANGTTPILVSTDLASRGLDIPAVNAVVHYHLPLTEETWTHRNGRTARQDASGEVYVITSDSDSIPPFVTADRTLVPQGKSPDPIRSETATLYFNVGKKEKISRGDIVGYLVAKGGLEGSEIGRIDLRDHCALVAVPRDKAREVLAAVAPHKIKNTRARITLLR